MSQDQALLLACKGKEVVEKNMVDSIRTKSTDNVLDGADHCRSGITLTRHQWEDR